MTEARCAVTGCPTAPCLSLHFRFWAAAHPDAVAIGTPTNPIFVCAQHKDTNEFFDEPTRDAIRAAFADRGYLPPDRFDVVLVDLA